MAKNDKESTSASGLDPAGNTFPPDSSLRDVVVAGDEGTRREAVMAIPHTRPAGSMFRHYPKPGDQIEVVCPENEVLGTLEVDDRMRIAFCRADGAIISLTDETMLDTIWAEVFRRREAQDAQWGGPAHDDTHARSEWCGFIRKFLYRAENAGPNAEPGWGFFESSMTHVAALAIAAIQSSRRKRGVR